MACTIESCMRTGTGTNHGVRRHVSGEKCKARVLTKAQQVIMDFWVMNDAKMMIVLLLFLQKQNLLLFLQKQNLSKLMNILLDGVGLGSHERVDN